MIVTIGGNALTRAMAVFLLGWRIIVPLAMYCTTVYLVYKKFNLTILAIPATPISVLGVGLSIFLGFKNSAAYDRWWEARKIWGGVVNASRTFGSAVMGFLTLPEGAAKGKQAKAAKAELQQHQKVMIHRHIAWLNALRLQLRKQDSWEELQPFLSEEEYEALQDARNKATMLNHMQANHMAELYNKGYINEFQQIQMFEEFTTFYDLQGKCERIKNTPFPRYYRYFTRVFLFIFVILLPFVMLKPFGWTGVPISTGIAFAFWLIESSGRFAEDPFENSFNDTPMTALCRTIEIDMRQQLGETELPQPIQPKFGILM